MNNEVEQKYKRFRNIFFGLCILAAALLLLTTLKNIINSVAAASWETHQGIVTNGSEDMSRILATPYNVTNRWLEYKYEINGNEYRNTTVGYGINKPASVLRIGDSIKVYVDPKNHATSVLAVGFAKGHLVGLLFSCGFVVLGFYLWRKV
ncbi:MAG: DUF3592 domain-containing protein [Candidatus Saccharibacteria bacterium]|nr:DUF3592 domain-containing protein [Candidatus Saccharibacteria bacterium]